MPKYTVTSPIKFKGKRREIDSVVEMSEEDAQPLVKMGALELPKLTKAAAEAAEKAAAEAQAKADAEAKAKAKADAAAKKK